MRKLFAAMLLAALFALLSTGAAADRTVTTTVLIGGESAREAVLREGEDATLRVTVTGATVASYQWYRDGISLFGANSCIYTILDANAGDAGIYALEAYDGEGNLLIRVEIRVRVILPGVPASGDASAPVWMAFAGAGASGCGLVLMGRRKKRSE